MIFFNIICLICIRDDFCEPPYPEYQPIEGADLVQVHLITRHGARTHLHIPKGFSNVWTCHNVEKSSFDSKYSNMNIHVSNGKSIFLGNCHFSQLLETGIIGLTHLGSYMRSIYIDYLKFLPTNYKSSIIRLRTTQSLRTIHSQLNFVKGFYPQATDNDFEIEIADKIYDPWRSPETFCPHLSKAVKSVRESNEFRKFTDSSFQSYASQVLGVPWSQTYDALVPALCKNYKVPKEVNRSFIKKIISMKAEQLQYIYSQEAVTPYAFGFCLAEMVNSMIDRISGRSKLRFVYWSAHDNNIVGFLGMLGHRDGDWPPFGSYVTVELWKNKKGKKLFVVIRYNGQILGSPRFGGRTQIPFDELKVFSANIMPDLLNECHFNLSKFKKKNTIDFGK